MMKLSLSTAVGLVVVLLYCSETTTAGGYLSFLSLYSYSSVPSGDDTHSGYIYTSGGFPFGERTVYSVYVSTNGYFSLGKSPTYSYLSFPGSSSYSVVAPYAADITTSNKGYVRYKDFDTYDSQISNVNSFIRSQTGDSFYGTRMMVAEWNVSMYSYSSSTSTFQGILITNGSSSYAVFIYECGGMDWGGAAIGWQASTSQYNSHYLSGRSSSYTVGCLYSFSYSAIVYTLHREPNCDSYEFTCDNGKCESLSDRCDGYDDCGDNSDESGCSTSSTSKYNGCASYQFTCDNGECEPESYRCDSYDDCGDNSDEDGCVDVGLVVGLTVGLFSLFLFIGIPVCVFILAYCVATKSRSRPTVQTRVVATAPSTGGTTVVTSNQVSSLAAPVTQPQYQLYKCAQDAPPSYDAATAFPCLAVQQGYPQQVAQYQPNLPYPTQHQGYPPVATLPNQTYPPPTQAAPDGGVNVNTAFLLQQ